LLAAFDVDDFAAEAFFGAAAFFTAMPVIPRQHRVLSMILKYYFATGCEAGEAIRLAEVRRAATTPVSVQRAEHAVNRPKADSSVPPPGRESEWTRPSRKSPHVTWGHRPLTSSRPHDGRVVPRPSFRPIPAARYSRRDLGPSATAGREQMGFRGGRAGSGAAATAAPRGQASSISSAMATCGKSVITPGSSVRSRQASTLGP
jgi:hypothetical protein